MIVAHLVVIAIAVSFVSLGLWQVRRHGEQVRENERITAQLAQEPLAISTALARPDPDLLPVVAEGAYEAAGEVQLGPRSRNERPGYEILTPFRLAGSDTVVMVDRGWVPLDDAAPPPPGGTTTIQGRLRLPQQARQVLTDDQGQVTLVSGVDLTRLAEHVDGLDTAAWVEVVDEQAREAGVIPRPAEDVVVEDGPHLSYAAQWFAFTVIGLIGYPLLLRRRLADDTTVASSSTTGHPGRSGNASVEPVVDRQ